MKNPSWIWTEAQSVGAHSYLRFRRAFRSGTREKLTLSITADARYWLWVNGKFVGHGPVRNWPNHWMYDQYDLDGLLRDGENVIAVLVHRLGIGTFQYLPSRPGLAVEVSEGEKIRLITDESWKSSPSEALALDVPRISVQQAFEEQFDARREDGWRMTDFDDAGWSAAISISAPHTALELRDIPQLSSEKVLPARVVRVERVGPLATTWALDLKRFLLPDEKTAKVLFVRGFLCSQIWSESPQTVTIGRPHHHGGVFLLNGREQPGVGADAAGKFQELDLRAGWNSLAFPIPFLNRENMAPARTHAGQFVVSLRSKEPLRWSSRAEAESFPWSFVGPYGFSEEEREIIGLDRDFPRVLVHPSAVVEGGSAEFLAAYERACEDELGMEIPAEFISDHDVFAAAYADIVLGTAEAGNTPALCDGEGWTLIEPHGEGEGVRLLLDYERELLGCHEFIIEAGEGTIVDFHSFEFIQPDGRENLAEGMNNTLRYTCREGVQEYRSLLRRGFQYTYVIFRNLRRPVRIKSITVDFVSYPQTRIGDFNCSDPRLNTIWEVGAHTLRCCAEDTYTDCPSYEQVLWVGDARNEALIDWVINGDSRLWFRCLRQAGQSLEDGELPLTASQVPSAWPNIIPAWSFLWMRSCAEYLLWTGDVAGARELLPWIERNVDGIEAHLNVDGLFSLQAYNLFDWAGMDTPSTGIVTHNNCSAVHALRDCAALASWLDEPERSERWEALAKSIARAVNERLWDEDKAAYLDSIHADGRRSAVFSQQTQAVAALSGVAEGPRTVRCAEILDQPPEGFVRSGTPFFEFFRLELLHRRGLSQECLDAIRGNWGLMVDQGATTFWEMWSRTGRLTRSHCHGWSAAPTYFLSASVLGIRPLEPGFRKVTISPRLGDLEFAGGTMPTPFGPIRASFERTADGIVERIELPSGIERV